MIKLAGRKSRVQSRHLRKRVLGGRHLKSDLLVAAYVTECISSENSRVKDEAGGGQGQGLSGNGKKVDEEL